jgi:hypothetical protein
MFLMEMGGSVFWVWLPTFGSHDQWRAPAGYSSMILMRLVETLVQVSAFLLNAGPAIAGAGLRLCERPGYHRSCVPHGSDCH